MKFLAFVLILFPTICLGQTVRTADLLSGEEVVWVEPISCGHRVSATPLIISREDTVSEVLLILGSQGTWLINPRLEINGVLLKGIRSRTWLNESQYAGNYVERFTVRLTESTIDLLLSKPFVRLVGEVRSTDSLDVSSVGQTTKTLLAYVRRLQKARRLE